MMKCNKFIYNDLKPTRNEAFYEITKRNPSLTMPNPSDHERFKSWDWAKSLQHHKNTSYQVFKNLDMMRFYHGKIYWNFSSNWVFAQPLNLIYTYQTASFKPHSKGKNEARSQLWKQRIYRPQAIRSAGDRFDFYVRFRIRWAYICFSIDLYNQEIIGLSVSTRPEILLKGDLQSIP